MRREEAKETAASDAESASAEAIAEAEDAAAAAATAAAAAAAAVDALAVDLEAKAALGPAAANKGGAGAGRAMRDGGAVGAVGLVYSDIMELHEGPPHHLECPARHAAVVAKIRKDGLENRCVALLARLAEDDELLTCHSRAHIDTVEGTFDPVSRETVQGGHGDIFWTEHTARCARLATGSTCEAVAAVATGEVHRALAVVRPPGHHAECQRAMGFCFYNNTAVAARTALQLPGVNRVLLLDWDVHHGNGIQDILYDDPTVMYISLHRYGNGFYPGTGGMEEVGKDAGTGYTVNVPWGDKGLGDADYLAAFDLVIDPITRAFAPDLVIVAAGFDAAEGDPLGGMKVSDQGYALMTHRLTQLAGGRCVAALEGGYGLSATASAAASTLSALLGVATPPLSSRRRPKRSTVELLRRVVDVQSKYWPTLESEEQRAKLRAAFKSTQVVGREPCSSSSSSSSYS